MKKKLTKFLTISNICLHPPKLVIFIFPPIVFSILIYIFIKGYDQSIPAYIIYAMSAYCLTICLVPLPKLITRTKTIYMTKLTSTSFGKIYVDDLAFRGSINIYQGMIANFLYMIFRIIVGIRYASVWFISMAVYYMVLGVMRLSLILSYRSSEPELRCYRKTAWLLFLLNVPMGGMITLIVITNSGYSYPRYVIYISAMYTFYSIIISVINLVKFRRLGNPILSAARVLNFVAALMSLIGLQTAMISQFSDNGDNYRKMFNAITGGSVWLIVILIAVYMIFYSNKLLRKDKPE